MLCQRRQDERGLSNLQSTVPHIPRCVTTATASRCVPVLLSPVSEHPRVNGTSTHTPRNRTHALTGRQTNHATCLKRTEKLSNRTFASDDILCDLIPLIELVIGVIVHGQRLDKVEARLVDDCVGEGGVFRRALLSTSRCEEFRKVLLVTFRKIVGRSVYIMILTPGTSIIYSEPPVLFPPCSPFLGDEQASFSLSHSLLSRGRTRMRYRRRQSKRSQTLHALQNALIRVHHAVPTQLPRLGHVVMQRGRHKDQPPVQKREDTIDILQLARDQIVLLGDLGPRLGYLGLLGPLRHAELETGRARSAVAAGWSC